MRTTTISSRKTDSVAECSESDWSDPPGFDEANRELRELAESAVDECNERLWSEMDRRGPSHHHHRGRLRAEATDCGPHGAVTLVKHPQLKALTRNDAGLTSWATVHSLRGRSNVLA